MLMSRETVLNLIRGETRPIAREDHEAAIEHVEEGHCPSALFLINALFPLWIWIVVDRPKETQISYDCHDFVVQFPNLSTLSNGHIPAG